MICATCLSEGPDSDTCPTCGEPPWLDGRYALEQVVGRGTAGVVYRARQRSDGRLVAVKTLSLPPGRDPKLEMRCIREIEVLRQLSHPAVPSWIAHFFTGRGGARQLHLAQVFVEGETLAEEARHHRYTEPEVLDILEELAGILGDLHTLSPPIVHRDVKPGNVIRGRACLADGSRGPARLHLVDFGAVRDAIRDPALGGSTVAGTFGYMAPEQFRGDASPASDAYGLGALGVALLSRRDPGTLMDWSGRLRWREALGERGDVPRQRGAPALLPHADGAPPLRPATSALLDRLLAPDPELRPTSMAQIRSEIAAIRNGTARAPRRRGRVLAASAALVVSVALAVAWVVVVASDAGEAAGSSIGATPPPSVPPAPSGTPPPPRNPGRWPDGRERSSNYDAQLEPTGSGRVVVPAVAAEAAARCASDGLLGIHEAQNDWSAAFDTYNADPAQLGWLPDASCRWYTAFQIDAAVSTYEALGVVTRGDGAGRVFRISEEGTVYELGRRSAGQLEELVSVGDWFGNLPNPTGPDGSAWKAP